MSIKRVLALLLAVLLFLFPFGAAAASYKHGDTVRVTVKEVWAFHGGRQAGETSSTSNGGNRANHYNNRLYWYEGYSIDILQTKDLQAAQYNGLTYFFCIHKWQAYNGEERLIYTDGNGNLQQSTYWRGLGTTKQRLLQLLSIYGFPAQTPQALGVSTVDDAYAATQAIAWEIVTSRRTLDGFTANYKSSGNEDTPKVAAAKDNARYFLDKYMHYAYDGNGHHVGEATPALAAYNKIWSDMARHDVLASFNKQALSLTWDAATKAYTSSVTDANEVLAGSSLSASLPSGVSCSVQGNTVTFTASTQIKDPITVTFQKNLSSMPDTTPFAVLEAAAGGGQEMMSGVMDDPRRFSLNVRTDGGSLRLVKTSEDGKVGNVPFRIVGQSVDQTVRTQADGSFQLELPSGVYTVTEQTESKYEPQESRRVTVVGGQTSTITFNNSLKRGDLTVTKTAEDGLAAGAKFRLTGTSLSGLPVDEYAVTDSSGKAYFRDVLIGSGYTLEEVDTAIRYVIPDNQTAAVEWNKVTNKSFHNILKKWSLTVTKSDSEKGLPQGDASLAGARYGIYKGDQLIDAYETDRNGQFTTKSYACGNDWNLREIAPSEGYRLNTESLHIGAEAKRHTVEYNHTALDVLETIQKGKIALLKHSDDGSTQIETPEAGAEFEVFLKSSGSYGNAKESERDTLICDENGFAQTKDLPYGVYTVKQTKGWEGKELLPAFDVFVQADVEVYRFLINNAAFRSLVEIVKKDAETGKTIPAAGIGFKVRNTDTGKFVVQHVNYPTPMDIDTFYTDTTGRLMLPEPLDYGNYEIIEQCTAYGYVLDSSPVPFTVDGSLAVVTVEKRNTAQKGIITIDKIGEVFFSVTESGGLYQPVYGTVGLAGATYEVYADEDIVTLDGTVRAKKGSLVATIETGTGGSGTSGLLYLGKYKIVEKQAPYGMTLNTTPLFVELTYAGENVKITGTEAACFNERQKAEICLDKVLEQDERFDIGMKDEILSVQFGLYAAENLAAADGSVIPADGLLEIVNCGKNGKAVFQTDIPVGAKLYVQEIATDSHYILSDEKFPVVFQYAGQDVATVNLSASSGKPIQNGLIYGNIKGLKIDRETGETIAGAQFGLFKPDETIYTEENAILTAQSQEDGVFRFETIPYGNWLVKELQPADGFLPNEETYPVTVTADEETIEITVVNDRIPEIGTTAAAGGEKQTHPGETITIEDEVAYRHLIPGREYVLKGVLMDKATGKPFLVDGAEVCADVVFVPEKPSGTALVSFSFDGSGTKSNTEIVVFERLYRDGVELAVHANIEDEGQTVTVLVPEIGTTAAVDGEKEICATEVFALEDVVSYENLIPGKEYTLKGILMDKTTGEPLMINGEEIHVETAFTPDEPAGQVTVFFSFDSTHIKANTEIVVFERLCHDGRELAVHADIRDEGQTVTVLVPEIGTTASVDGAKEICASEVFTLEDVVTFRNLTPGKEYVLKGVLMDKSTNQPLLIDGKEIRAEVTFIPETTDGEVIVPFVFDSRFLKEDMDVVAYEALYREDRELAVHADMEDKGQTVMVKVPEIWTQAAAEGKKEITASDKVVIEDTVTYKNLTPGKEYVLKGVLMDKATGKPFIVNEKEICAEILFVPEASDGEATVSFLFDASGIAQETDVVVFECLYRDNVEIVTHADIEDEGQTVRLIPPAPPVPIPPTGENSHSGFWIGLGAVALGGLIAALIIGIKRKKDDDE